MVLESRIGTQIMPGPMIMIPALAPGTDLPPGDLMPLVMGFLVQAGQETIDASDVVDGALKEGKIALDQVVSGAFRQMLDRDIEYRCHEVQPLTTQSPAASTGCLLALNPSRRMQIIQGAGRCGWSHVAQGGHFIRREEWRGIDYVE